MLKALAHDLPFFKQSAQPDQLVCELLAVNAHLGRENKQVFDQLSPINSVLGGEAPEKQVLLHDCVVLISIGPPKTQLAEFVGTHSHLADATIICPSPSRAEAACVYVSERVRRCSG